jgi:hypothetical protein
MSEQPAIHRKVLRFQPLTAMAVGPAYLGACVVVSMRIGFQGGLGIASSGALGVLFALASVGWCLLPGLRKRHNSVFRFHPERGEIITLLFLVLVSVLLWDRAADRSMFWPHAYGVDHAHHAALATFILDTNGPPKVVPQLGGMANYPAGAHELTAFISTLTHLNPLSATWFTGLLSAFFELWAVAWLAFTLARRIGALSAIAATGLWILGWHVGIGMVTRSFFFSQSLSILFGTVGAGLITIGQKGPNHNRRWFLPAAILGLSAFLTYPQSAVVIPGAFLATLAVPLVQRTKNAPALQKSAAVVGAFILLFSLFRFVDNSPSLRGAIQGRGEGMFDKLSITSVGGPLAAVVLAIGGIIVARLSTTQKELRPLFGALLAPIGLAALLLMLRRGGFPVINYRIDKNGQTAFPFLAVAGGFGISYHSARLPSSVFRSQVFRMSRVAPTTILTACTALASVAFVSRPTKFTLTTLQLVDRDSYVLARSVTPSLKADDVGIAGDGLASYTLWWAGVGRTASYDWEPLIPRMTLFDDWPQGPRPEKYLLVDPSVRARYESRPGVRVYKSRNGAAILERIDK